MYFQPLGEGGALLSIRGASNKVTINAAWVFYYWGYIIGCSSSAGIKLDDLSSQDWLIESRKEVYILANLEGTLTSYLASINQSWEDKSKLSWNVYLIYMYTVYVYFIWGCTIQVL